MMKEKQDSFNILENKLFRMKENVINVYQKKPIEIPAWIMCFLFFLMNEMSRLSKNIYSM